MYMYLYTYTYIKIHVQSSPPSPSPPGPPYCSIKVLRISRDKPTHLNLTQCSALTVRSRQR